MNFSSSFFTSSSIVSSPNFFPWSPFCIICVFLFLDQVSEVWDWISYCRSNHFPVSLGAWWGYSESIHVDCITCSTWRPVPKSLPSILQLAIDSPKFLTYIQNICCCKLWTWFHGIIDPIQDHEYFQGWSSILPLCWYIYLLSAVGLLCLWNPLDHPHSLISDSSCFQNILWGISCTKPHKLLLMHFWPPSVCSYEVFHRRCWTAPSLSSSCS